LESHDGVFPRSFDEVLGLPGIGRYTAGAVCSIAFNLPTPVLDGNVIRVLSRLHAVGGDPKSRAVNERLWESAGDLVRSAGSLPPMHAPDLAGNCSALNQALMELGALVCTPREPRCAQCPVGDVCAARRLGQVERFPLAARRAPVVVRRVVAVVLERRGRLFLERRPEGGVNAGLWQFPSREVPVTGEVPLTGMVAPGEVEWRPLVTVRHSITNSRIELRAFHGRLDGGQRLAAVFKGRWLTPREAASRPFTGAHARVMRAWEGLTRTRSREAAKKAAR
jgi:A/G-specific adenine glycosylase